MIRLIFLYLLFVFFVTNVSYGGFITPFSENNSIDIVNGEVWVATQLSAPHCTRKGYIYRFNPHKNIWKLHSFSSPILCINHVDSSVWLGTYGDGIITFNDEKSKKFTTENTGRGNIGQTDGLISNYVNTIVVDKQNVYCATVGGLSIYNITQNKWISFNSKNSPLLTSYIFDLEKKGNKIWLATSNYWYVHYEKYPMGNEKGNIASFNIKSKKWETFSGMRKKYESDTSFIELEGDIPAPNSDFSNVTIDEFGNLWFAFRGGLGVYRNGIWKIYSKTTCDIDFGHISDIATGKFGVWVACDKGLLEYKEKEDAWIIHQKESNKIPGSVIRSIYVGDNSVWVKSYDPNFWEKQGLSPDPFHEKQLREKSEFHRLKIDGNIVDIKCVDKNNWKKLYNPGYMEFLTVYENGKWKSWELTRMLIEDLTK
jgi:ligand-binding sensor domain-containing protein